ncbi:MAG: hypothetical protein ACEPOW_03895, partial [Bacteroidales bacterium]
GIRTPGGSHLNGFQDRRIRPLCHFSVGKDTKKVFRANFFIKKMIFFCSDLSIDLNSFLL